MNFVFWFWAYEFYIETRFIKFICSRLISLYLGDESCEYSRWKCPTTNNLCKLTVFDSDADYLQIDASQTNRGDLVILSDTNSDSISSILEISEVHCPNNGYCNITCVGNRACKNVDVYSQEWTILNVMAPYGGEKVLDSMDIYCPTNTVPGNNKDCNVFVNGNDRFMLDEVKFYAIESFYDLTLTCIHARGVYRDCFAGNIFYICWVKTNVFLTKKLKNYKEVSKMIVF